MINVIHTKYNTLKHVNNKLYRHNKSNYNVHAHCTYSGLTSSDF